VAERFPKDRFDEIPENLERTGAHRAPPARGRGWVGFAWAALASGILVVIGLLVLARLNEDVNFELPGSTEVAESAAPEASAEPEASASATPEEVAPVTDPSGIDFDVISITMLNGTTTAGLAAQAGDALEEQGWVVETRTNASENDVATSVVYYYDEANEGIALGVAQELGVTAVEQSAAFPGASVTVVLGADYEQSAE
jgi:hypothetical protein